MSLCNDVYSKYVYTYKYIIIWIIVIVIFILFLWGIFLSIIIIIHETLFTDNGKLEVIMIFVFYSAKQGTQHLETPVQESVEPLLQTKYECDLIQG